MQGGLRLVSGDELAGLTAPPDFRRIRALVPRARQAVPALRDQPVATEWMGFRPSTPNSLPVIGVSPRGDEVVHAFGHGHLGLTLAAITAQMVADAVAGRPAPFDPVPTASAGSDMNGFPITLATPREHHGPMPEAVDIAVIGGGIIGLMAAWELAARRAEGAAVRKGPHGREQSGRNWGWLRQQGRDLVELPMMTDAMRLWRDLPPRLREAVGFRQTGITYLARTEAHLEATGAGWTTPVPSASIRCFCRAGRRRRCCRTPPAGSARCTPHRTVRPSRWRRSRRWRVLPPPTAHDPRRLRGPWPAA